MDDLPLGKSDLRTAIEAWKECSTYGGFLWKHLSMDDSGLEKFRKPEVRKILADEGRRCMLKDIEAIERVEDLLTGESV